MATSKIAQHRHCRSCGKAFVSDDMYCSSECKNKSTSTIQKKKRQLMFLYAISFIVLIVALLFL
jgi:predicted nucleic acid-binding Zn ribbon protein